MMEEIFDGTVPHIYDLIEFKNRFEANIAKPLNIKNIFRFENFCKVIFFEGKDELKTVTIKWFYAHLDHEAFIKPNRKDILNMNHIKKYNVYQSIIVITSNDFDEYEMSHDNKGGLIQLRSFLPAIPRFKQS